MVVIVRSFSPPADGIIFQTAPTKARLNDVEVGTGTLYITENNVIWGGGVNPNGGPAPSLNLVYESISMHAIQREPAPALFIVVNYDIRLPEFAHQLPPPDPEEEHPFTQIRFYPENEGELQQMYSAMTQGQSLHPDSADEVDQDDHYLDGQEFLEPDDEFEDAEEVAANPVDRLRHLRLDNGSPGEDDDGEFVEK